MVGLIDKIVSVFKPRDTLNGSSESFCDSYYSSREGKLVLKLQKIASEYPFVEVGGYIFEDNGDFELSDLIFGDNKEIYIPMNSSAFASWHSHPQKIISKKIINSAFLDEDLYLNLLPILSSFPLINVPSVKDIYVFLYSNYTKGFIIGPSHTVILEKTGLSNSILRSFGFDFPLGLYSRYLDMGLCKVNFSIPSYFGLNTTIVRNRVMGKDYISFLKTVTGSLDRAFEFSETVFGLKPGKYTWDYYH